MSELSTFGVRLKAARTGAKLNQEELAKRVGSSKGYISELETNPDIRPSAELVMKLAEELQTTVETLMRGEITEAPADAVFFRNYQSLDEPTKSKLQGILRLLKDD
ncbi:helix-turn-helix domain-containing protein [Rhodanobacter denitrificans]|uniref:helix-turn-helix domain-containing protein n=1 Tax=Rhodanobacter denitrificans TaxID=666685 RepID=UPI00166F698F|nr:helix-turn-helix transcriptional regulator [Rhodanobacter denitrificans]